MRLMHYRTTAIDLNRCRVYSQHPPYHVFDKPNGFWVSVEGDDDWPSWCTENGFCLDSLAVAHEVTLTDEANVLWIRTHTDVRAFAAKYGIAAGPEMLRYRSDEPSINWPQVAQDYAGIIVTRWMYSWGDPATAWLYTWDCTSGCIWDLTALATITPVAEQVTA